MSANLFLFWKGALMNNYTRLMIELSDDELVGVSHLAKKERRDLRAQAAVLIRQSLERLGFLQPPLTLTDTSADYTIGKHSTRRSDEQK